MTEAARISRTVETDLSADDLWELIADADGWRTWMVDAADVEVTPGATGTVVDDGATRDVRIERVDPGGGGERRVCFAWWPHERPDLGSTVELVVVPAPGRTRLHVTESYPAASSASALAWDVRLLLVLTRALAVRA